MWCSIIPLFLIWDLSRSFLERLLLSILLALGVCASAAALTTLILLVQMSVNIKAPNMFRDTLPILTWCLLEGAILIVASCAPLLKTTIEKGLSRLGMPVFHNVPRELGTYRSSRVSHGSRCHISWIWRKRNDNPLQPHNNTAVTKNSGGDSTSSLYNKDTTTSDIGSSSSQTTASVRMEPID